MHALIVDDDDMSLVMVENVLQQMGYEVRVARNGREALHMLHQEPTHLVITDWEMPEMNGLELCQAIRREDFNGYVYVIMITARDSSQQKIEGLHAGADNFITKPLNPGELLVCLKTAERILALETRDLAIFALAKLAESRDTETGAHIERVQAYTRILAEQLAATDKYRSVIDAEYIRLIHQTSPLHDIGKVGIPDHILLKPGKLDESEFAIMKQHTGLGAQTLDAALQRFPNARFLQMARQIAATHHEKYDGTGYPAGLIGEDIPLCGRIVALADVYDALTSRRVYKDAMSHQQAKAIIVQESGSHFDPEVVTAFLAREERFISVRETLADGDGADHPRETPLLHRFAPQPNGEPSRPAILLARSDPAAAAMAEQTLRRTGYDVLVATDGTEALETLANSPVRLVVVDLTLARTDGLELCRRVRSCETCDYVFVMLLADEAQRDRMVEAFDAGADDFLVDPFAQQELLARLRAGLRTIRLHDELDRRNRGSAQLNAQLARLNSSLEKMAITDDLTGLCNRRQALAKLDEQCALAERYGGPLSVAMLDLDFFKRVNDTYGHDAGDEVLRGVAAILRATVRSTDTVSRIGGEEFLLIFPAQCAQEAAISAERCRKAIAQHVFKLGNDDVTVTTSAGIAARRAGMLYGNELVKQADVALYDAKHRGRNYVSLGHGAVALSAP